MSESPKDKDQEKGDEILRRLLKTPPKPHQDSDTQPKAKAGTKGEPTKALPKAKHR
jgi:hypothetical protein